MMKILTVVGARPQFIKAATISRAIGQRDGITEVMAHTGQHFDDSMSDIFFSELEIPAPAYHFAIHGGPHGAMTGRMLEAVEGAMLTEQPDMVLVYGDTNSTLAGALAAAKLHIPVAHVEAGLRSFNRRMPEEINRVMTDHVSTLLFCPTVTAVANLAQEGVTAGVHLVGDVMYDATLHAGRVARSRSNIVERLGLPEKGYTLATLHRAENTDDPAKLAKALDFLKSIAQKHPVLLPLHPRTQGAAERAGLSFEGLTVCPPLGYLNMQRLLASAAEVATDSGGLQKEAYFHRVPCVTLRDETEWVETVEAGWNRLWTQPNYASPRHDIADYGDGQTAEKIIELMLASQS